MKHQSKQLVAAVMVVALFATTFVGCAKTAEEPAAATAAESSGEEVVSEGVMSEEMEVGTGSDFIADEVNFAGTDPNNLDPFYGSKSMKCIFFATYQRLFGLDNNGQLFPVLAKDYEIVDDAGLVYQVHLYDYIHDQAGNPFTASDVVFSYNRWKEEGFNSNTPKLNFDNIVAIDDYTVQFTFDKPMVSYNEIWYYFGANDLTTEAAFNASPSQLASDACGTGPYKITEYVPGVSIKFERDENYWQTDKSLIYETQYANVNVANMYFISEGEQIVVALQSGQIDFTQESSYAGAQQFMEGGEYDDGFGVFLIYSNDINSLFFNCDSSSIFSDINMRLAVCYGIDTAVFCGALNGSANAIYGIGGSRYFDYDVDYWLNHEDYEHVYDVEKAKEYLKAAGYNGETVTILANATDSYGSRKTLAEVLGAFLDAMGISYEIQAVDSTTAKNWKNDPSKWDIYVNGTNANDSLVNLWYKDFDYSSSTTGETTWFFAKDDKLEEMLTTARSSDTYSADTLNAFVEYVQEQAYCYTLCEIYQCCVYNTDKIEEVAYTGPQSQFTPGAFVYVNPDA